MKPKRRYTKKNKHPLPQNVYPIGFSIPGEKIVASVPPKTKLLSSLIPGKPDTYIYNTEEDYYNEYKQSIFARTLKKAGWDCMRHYEIMANGCIPYFPDIEKCPPNTMTLIPKQLIIKGNALYEKLKDKNIDDLTSVERNKCSDLANRILNHTREKLTTRALAEYVLKKAKHQDAKKILYIKQPYDNQDYLRDLLLHGFKHTHGTNFHDWPKISYVYKSTDIDYSKLYGKGITYTNLLEPSMHDDSLDSTIEDDIKNKKYDLVIYGSYHAFNTCLNEKGEEFSCNYVETMPYYDLVKTVYKPEEIILFCGHDIHQCEYTKYNMHHVFVREI